ncbi:MAG: hypothetical protein HQL66_06520 [Magnetococcales bacterium]|nr:hypothetical protein [Magnetococcales bacterium]
MGVLRFVLIGLMFLIVFQWFKVKWRRFIRMLAGNPALNVPQPLVACVQCGTRVPAQTIVADHDRAYCSQACHDAASRSRNHE